MNNTLTTYTDEFLRRVADVLPSVVGALLILLIGYFIARVLANVVARTLMAVGLDRRLHEAQGGHFIQRVLPRPSDTAGQLTFWVLYFLVISLAISVLGIPLLEDFVRAIYAYIPNVIAAVLIFLVASAVSVGVTTLARDAMGDTPTGRVVASAVPVVVMGLATFMILSQLQIAKDIVTITYTALIGSAALGMALAFGFGGREVAARILEEMYGKSKGQVAQVKRDVELGANRAKNKLS